jgi:CRP-like cAMP-binding protein
MVSFEGKECLLDLLSTGDIFGELSLSGANERLETATAMGETIVRKIACHKFIAELSTNSSSADFITYLVERMAEQKNIIAGLMTLDSKRRLAEILVQLARKFGRPTSNGMCIEHRITHEELSEMVGTVRHRITEFLQEFRRLGFVEMNSKHLLLVKVERLTTYLKTR